ncbi:hypothetical protein B0T25DRAFT_537274 [Lasiosphaeria hispida]|uniref:Uncharacterized protein n=1 Tax=Lasiosphaeria hispida TaxID=260671 RepID=A0AAJ0HL19_9PEZI|nr:hypothetical protein B0T25DRAFT_537274 [Lasiosphaeria hispida]
MPAVEPEPTPSSTPLNPANTSFSSTSISSTTTSSTPDPADSLPTARKKRGRPCTGIANRYNKRAYNPPPPKKKTKVFRTRAFKIKVLDYLIFNIVPVTENDHNDRIRSNMPSITILDGERYPGIPNGFRRPTYDEAKEHFDIPRTTIQNWWHAKERIVLGPVYLFRARWAVLEREFFNLFVKQRATGKIIRIGWFKRSFFFASIMILLILNLSAL